jgi:hypothetical protein
MDWRLLPAARLNRPNCVGCRDCNSKRQLRGVDSEDLASVNGQLGQQKKGTAEEW